MKISELKKFIDTLNEEDLNRDIFISYFSFNEKGEEIEVEEEIDDIQWASIHFGEIFLQLSRQSECSKKFRTKI